MPFNIGEKIMAKLEKSVQTAECVKVKDITFTTKKGETVSKQIYTMALDGNKSLLFEVFQSDRFTARVGEIYTPLLNVVNSAYVGTDGNAYSRPKLFVDWEKVGG